jgi:ABC-type enterobactin transport system permease subunit
MRNGVLRRWILLAAVIVVVGIGVGAILLAVNWPFTQAAVTKALQDRFAREVRIRKFHSTLKESSFSIVNARSCRP